MTILQVLVDQLLEVYDKADKSIILASEVNEELKYIYKKYWKIARDFYGIPIDVYKQVIKDAKAIVNHERRFQSSSRGMSEIRR